MTSSCRGLVEQQILQQATQHPGLSEYRNFYRLLIFVDLMSIM